MSVINKMLRDLDSRQAADATPRQAQESRTGIASGTLLASDSEGDGRRRGSSRRAGVIAAVIIVAGSAAGAWWYLHQTEFLQRKVAQVKAPSVPVSGTSVVAAALLAEPIAIASAVPASIEPDNAPLKALIVAAPVATKLPLPVKTTTAVPPSAAAQADMSLKMDSTLMWAPSHATPSRLGAAVSPRVVPERLLTERPVAGPSTMMASTVPAAAMVASQSPSRRSPALEALSQAQSLWSAGSHEAGIELLREALTVAERANLAGTPSGNNSVLASLVRELARMELAEGRVSQALEMLTRLEPSLSGFADVWALRGNAAQRLGRHEESAAAYLMALKLRPEEARWMLGAAVSLAAQGQTARAAELAEKARAGGVLSREVATYLRQLGVPLRER